MKHLRWFAALTLATALSVGRGVAQRSAREADQERGGELPTWKLDEPFKRDVFTFVRIKYSVSGSHGYGHRPAFRQELSHLGNRTVGNLGPLRN